MPSTGHYSHTCCRLAIGPRASKIHVQIVCTVLALLCSNASTMTTASSTKIVFRFIVESMSEWDNARNRPLISREIIERLSRKMRNNITSKESAGAPTNLKSARLENLRSGSFEKDSPRPAVSEPLSPNSAPGEVDATRRSTESKALQQSSSAKSLVVLPRKSKRRKKRKQTLMRLSRMAKADLLKEHDSIFRHNKKLGFTAGYSPAKRNKFRAARPISGGLCSGN
jgi:hypothetical protein